MNTTDADLRAHLPRVDMHYRIDVNGVQRRVDLPFVTVVFADLAGQPETPLPPIGDRRFVDVDLTNFDAWMAEVAPCLAFKVPDAITGEGELIVDLTFRSLDAFAPSAIAQGVPAVAHALEAAEHVGAQLDSILHHPSFTRLEAAWRALHRMVAANRPDGLCPIRVIAMSKAELAKTLKRYKGTAWDQSPIFKRIYTEGFGSPGGEPVGCVVLDFEFDHGPADVETLNELSKIGAASYALMLAAASPELLQMESWREVETPRDLSKIVMTPEYEAWRSLRDSDNACWIALVMPHYLERAPWRGERIGTEGQRYDENDRRSPLWANPAYLLAAVIQRSFRIHGWFAHISGLQGGGAVEGLAQAKVASAGERPFTLGPVEVTLTDRRIGELADLGLVPVVAYGKSGIALFSSPVPVMKPAEYEDPEATRDARLSANLPYQLMTGRIAHFMKAIGRDTFMQPGTTRQEAEETLNAWIADYVEPPPGAANALGGAPRPLSAARVTVEEVSDGPGHLMSKFHIRPR